MRKIEKLISLNEWGYDSLVGSESDLRLESPGSRLAAD